VSTDKTTREIAQELKAGGIRCNCDLDNWQPEQTTGHTCVCRIHKAAMERKNYPSARQQGGTMGTIKTCTAEVLE
jgi:hypothetical protein